MKHLISIFSLFILVLLIVPTLASDDVQWKEKLGDDLREKVGTKASFISQLVNPEKADVIIFTDDKESVKNIGDMKYDFQIIPAVATEIPLSKIESIARLETTKKILLDHPVKAFRIESIPLIKADNATSTFDVNGTRINISIVDTGVFNHTEFQSPNRIVLQKCYCTGCCPPNNVDENNNSTDDSSVGHGTHVAGVAAGNLGVANGSSILAVKVLDSSGSGSDSDVINGIDWSVQNGAKIISLSLGASYDSFIDCYDLGASMAVDNATEQGVIVIVATGNDGSSAQTIAAPACAKNVIAVGSSNDADVKASSSSVGPTNVDNRTKPDLMAPGVSISSTVNSVNGYAIYSGTSMSAPHVTGVAALLLEKYNQTFGYFPEPARVKAILLTAVNTTGMNANGYTQRNNFYGSGRTDAYEALRIINYTKNDTIQQNQQRTFYLNVTSPNLKVTLNWPENSTTYNHLSLILQAPNSTNYTNPSNVNDTVEQNFISGANTGIWKVIVNGTVVNDAQIFYLASNTNFITQHTTIESPSNTTYSQSNVHFNITIYESLTNAFISLNNTANETMKNDTLHHYYNATLTVPDGSHNATFYLNNSYGAIYSTVAYFSVDTTDPSIQIQSPQNVTYSQQNISLNLTVTDNSPISWCGYSLDDQTNITLTNCTNTTLANLSESTHSMTVYANDTIGNMNFSSVNFTIRIPPLYSNLTSTLAIFNQTFQANATWTDNANISTVLFESNFSSILTNYSVTTRSGNEYYFTISYENQTVNKFIEYRWYANDTNDIWNSTSQFNYTVIRAPTQVRLFLNGTEGNKNYQKGSIANITAIVNITEKNITIVANFSGIVILANGTAPQPNITNTSNLNISVYNITAYFSGDENYTGNFTTYYMSVLKPDGESCSIASECFDGHCNSGTCASSAPPTPSPSSSIGGGGGGILTIEKKTEVKASAIQANITIPSIATGKSENVSISNFSVREVFVEVKNPVINVKITVEKISTKPLEVTMPKGIVFHYLKIDKQNITDTDINKARIKFAVEKSWINSNNISESTVTLNRYASNQWNKLITSKVSENQAEILYQAESPGFSIFAITGEVKSCPSCPLSGNWTDCINDTQTRANYRCSIDTDYKCQPYNETKTCEATKPKENTLLIKWLGFFTLSNLKKYQLILVGIIVAIAVFVVIFIRKRSKQMKKETQKRRRTNPE